VHIYNVTITNFDDAVAVKPLNSEVYNNSTRNILVENSTVRYGVGMTIGSVPPHINVCQHRPDHAASLVTLRLHTKVNSVQDVVFRNIHFETPIKGIYIKSNPGDGSSAEILLPLLADML
jgi:polygalacturonase